MPTTETRVYRCYMCLICGFIYDEAEGSPQEGIPPGTLWEDVPMNWTCPECAARKEDFEMVEIWMRILHTMLRVGDLEKSIAFYTDVLGMKLLRRKDYPEGKFTLAFVGYQDEAEGAVLELTHNWGVEKYELGSGYGHIAIEVDNAYEACEEVKKRGGRVTREAGPMKHGATVIAFVEDPNGYKVELIQKKTA